MTDEELQQIRRVIVQKAAELTGTLPPTPAALALEAAAQRYMEAVDAYLAERRTHVRG